MIKKEILTVIDGDNRTISKCDYWWFSYPNIDKDMRSLTVWMLKGNTTHQE